MSSLSKKEVAKLVGLWVVSGLWIWALMVTILSSDPVVWALFVTGCVLSGGWVVFEEVRPTLYYRLFPSKRGVFHKRVFSGKKELLVLGLLIYPMYLAAAISLTLYTLASLWPRLKSHLTINCKGE